MKKQTNHARASGIILSVNLIITSVLISGCTTSDFSSIKNNTATIAEPISVSGVYFDTVVQVSLYDYNGKSNSILQGVTDLCTHYENLFSATIEGSDIWNINHAGGQTVSVSNETATLISDAIYYCKESDGLLDITLGSVSDLWAFSSQAESDSPSLPDNNKLQEALTHVDYTKVTVEGNEVTLSDPASSIELGFIAKGYIADRIRDYLLDSEVQSAIINLGGNIYVIGEKSPGTNFVIGIQKPFSDMGEYITKTHVSNLSVVSSGVYERYFYLNDKLYHHILDSETGYPYETDIYGVTIISPSSEQADALSTLCFILGSDKGIEYIETLSDVEAMYITSDYEMITSSGWK